MDASMNQQEFRKLEILADSTKEINETLKKMAQIQERQERFDQQYKDKFRDAILTTSRSFETIAGALTGTLSEIKSIATSLNDIKGHTKRLDDIASSTSTISKELEEIKKVSSELSEIKNILSKK